jgi:hypothetical protein
MGFFRRAESSRTYYGVTVTGDADRFRRAKTSGARKASKDAEKWERKDRAQDRSGRWYRPAR